MAKNDEQKPPQITSGITVIGGEHYLHSVHARPGDIIEYQAGVKNTFSDKPITAIIRIVIPTKIQARLGSVKLIRQSDSKPAHYYSEKDKMITNGVIIKEMKPKHSAYLRFQAAVPKPTDLPCGETDFSTKAKITIDGAVTEQEIGLTVNNECVDGTPQPHQVSSGQASAPAVTTHRPSRIHFGVWAAIVLASATALAGYLYVRKSHKDNSES
ncbi:MAG: hypothetical protein Q4P66_03810 [Actinomycetaceae bacterium]|nr:hypothetical protein [Actinomycetaceae bacterium]